MNTYEESQDRRSIVSDTLQKLEQQAQVWRDKINLLEAGQKVDRSEAQSDLEKLLDLCQNLRDAIASEDGSASWTNKAELHTLVNRLDAAAAKRQRYLDLAQTLSAGTVTHRRERTRLERLKQRDAAVAELMEISALAAPPELPGPAVEEWLSWACSLDDSTNDPDLKVLNENFPRVDDFVRQLEIEMWHDGGAAAQNGANGHSNGHAKQNGSNGSACLRIAEASPDYEPVSPYDEEGEAAEEAGETAVATAEEPAANEEAKTDASEETKAETSEDAKDARPVQNGTVSFFAPDEVEAMGIHLEKSKKESRKQRKVRALLAVSNWLTPRDQNPVLHTRCGIRAQLDYTGNTDLAPVTPDEATKTIESSENLPLLTGGADLLRWSLLHSADDHLDSIACIRRLSREQLNAWFHKIYKIELAEPQIDDMYKLTRGIPLLVGEMHRRTIPAPDAPPTWLGFAIWTQIKNSYEQHVPVLAEELRSGSPEVRLTEREIEILKMVVIASDDSTPDTLASNLMENWRKYHRAEFQALTSADDASLRLLLNLGLLPMRSDWGLRAIKAVLPTDADDPIRQLVKHL